MIKKTCFFLTISLSINAFGQSDKNQCEISLDNFNPNINAKTFFADHVLKKDLDQYMTKSGTPISAQEAFDSYGSTRKTKLIDVVESDIQKKYDVEGDEKIKIAKLFAVTLFKEDDQLICFENISFPTFKILAKKDDQFVALIAENRKVEQEKFNNVLKNLQKEHSLTKTDSKNFEIYTFYLKTYFIQFKKAKTSFRSESQIVPPSEKPEKTNVMEDITLVLLDKKADQKFLTWLNQND